MSSELQLLLDRWRVQLDVHIPALSVMETLEFASDCQNGLHADVYDQVEALETAIIKAAAEKGHTEERRRGGQFSADGEGSSAQDLHNSFQQEDRGPDSQEPSSTPFNLEESDNLGNQASKSPFHEASKSQHRSPFSVEAAVPAVRVIVDSQTDKTDEQSSPSISTSPPLPPTPPAPPSSSPPPPPPAPPLSPSGVQSGPSMSSPSRLDQHDLEAVAAAAKFGKEEEEVVALAAEMKNVRGLRTMRILRALGILHTMDTPVGDSMLRGVSGGERKRVTLAEMLVGGRRALFLDEISTGLDSATLYNIVNILKRMTAAYRYNTVVSLLQPPPEVFNLFHDLIVMAKGRIVYHGPVGKAVEFFRTLGLICPPRKDVPSFLQEVVTESGQLIFASEALLKSRNFQARSFPNGKKRFVVPIEEIEDAFWQSEVGASMMKKLERPYNKKLSHPAALKHGRFALSSWEGLKVVVQRQVLLVLKDSGLIKGRLIQTVAIGLIVGSLFYQLSDTESNIRNYYGAIFLIIMFTSMGGMIQMQSQIATKASWYKMRDNQFYPAWTHALSVFIVALPHQLLDSLLWSVITYFMIGFQLNAGRFFTFFLLVYLVNISFGALFRAIAHLAPDGIAANSFGGILLLILSTMSGFTILRSAFPDWWIWAYWLSPYSWALRSIAINELGGPGWDNPSSTNPGLTVGEAGLLSFDFFTEDKWIWGGVGYLSGFTIFFLMLSALALNYCAGSNKVVAVPDEDELEQARIKAAERKAKVAAALKSLNATTLKDPKAGPASTDHVQVHVDDATIPFEQVTVVWKNLQYFVPNPSFGLKGSPADTPKELELLKGITGFAEPGKLTALMGGSGAGKTTLMDCVAGRKTIGEIRGDIIVNGHPKEQLTWSRVMSYVEQMDIHTPAQTILEALLFSARLRLPQSTTKEEVRAFVDETMDLVDLTDIMFDLVGIPGQTGLSVEQRKRLTIANEMVANPSILFMDEPTSGLDARAAAIVMRTVRKVGDSHRAVVVTIHQPSIEIFEAFDNLLLLQRGGRTTFFGPLGVESRNLISYLESAPGAVPMKAGLNPATWMLEITGGAISVTVKAVDVNWPDMYHDSKLCAENEAYAIMLIDSLRATKQPLTVQGGVYASNSMTQSYALWIKFISAYWRMPTYNYIRYLLTIFSACMYGSMYYKAAATGNPVPYSSIQGVGGLIYGSASFVGMTNMMAVMPIISMERVVFYRERAASYYNPWVYGLVISMVELPYQLVQTCIFVGIVYFMLGFQQTAEAFFYYLSMTLFSLMFYVSFGMGSIYISPSQALSTVIAMGFNFLFNIFNGYVISYNDMPVYWKWLNRIAPTTWIIYGQVVNQLGYRTELVSGIPGTDVMPTVSYYMESVFGYAYNFRGWCLMITLAYIIFFRVMGVVALRYVNFLRR
ncbi:hypothetical protein CEUSTIGMA_g3111.t1 [Chlamydomonas eustigma]|uniref:ABC transporter domain-containing protein n=1 Tax=Chlamydomonas eustigma TaxID=1157962 RepID=A0A250WXU1_9CHLO|nr:hypothetical protein CEUSTIGMA_g3111.t1 [Chlamydomonas eustigma]|eukprot:GAX75668.1 hypothetical protein CEUSTIGMA_g3111.t1 [Chlamydomonas eustigma]